MVFTRKFSEFTAGTLDTAVGLEAGANTKSPSSGGGSIGVTHTFPMSIPPVAVGDWVRVDTAGVYTKAQADTPEHGEVIGVVVEADALTFTLQQSGYVESSSAVFSGLTAGSVYFLDTATTGTMVPTDATVNGEVSRPVFVADTPTSGWVVPYRGLIVGGAAPSSGGGGGSGTDTSLVTINQTAHGFVPGDVLRVSTASVGAPVLYAKAQSNTLANAQAVGIVCATPAPTANQFTLQFSGYNTGSISVDQGGTPVVAPGVYYLSSTVAGKVTATDPSTISTAISKPIYVVEQGIANLGVNAGYILPQRPLDFTTLSSGKKVITQAGHGFVAQDWLYLSANNTYAKGIATSLTTSQVVGVVIQVIDANTFILQQSGNVVGIVTQDGAAAPITSATVYYLSTSVPGRLQSTAPSVVGQFTKPLYVQQTLASNDGWILEQRPLSISASGGGTGTGPIVQSLSATIRTTFNFPAGTATVPGQSITITPTAATSNMLITVCCGGMNGSNTHGFRILRNGVVIAGATGTAPNSGSLDANPSNRRLTGAAAQYNDLAGTILPITYAVQAYTLGGAGSYNYGASPPDDVISTITVQEVL